MPGSRERGLFATRRIEVGEQLLTVPVGRHVTLLSLRSHPCVRGSAEVDAESRLTCALATELQNDGSALAPYLASLPSSFTHLPQSWDDGWVNTLRGTPLFERVSSSSSETSMAAAAVRTSLPRVLRGVSTLNISWALDVVRTRAFRGPLGTTLVPLADMCNFDAVDGEGWQFRHSDGAFVITASRAYHAGDQVTCRYRDDAGPGEVLLQYGVADPLLHQRWEAAVRMPDRVRPPTVEELKHLRRPRNRTLDLHMAVTYPDRAWLQRGRRRPGDDAPSPPLGAWLSSPDQGLPLARLVEQLHHPSLPDLRSSPALLDLMQRVADSAKIARAVAIELRSHASALTRRTHNATALRGELSHLRYVARQLVLQLEGAMSGLNASLIPAQRRCVWAASVPGSLLLRRGAHDVAATAASDSPAPATAAAAAAEAVAAQAWCWRRASPLERLLSSHLSVLRHYRRMGVRMETALDVLDVLLGRALSGAAEGGHGAGGGDNGRGNGGGEEEVDVDVDVAVDIAGTAETAGDGHGLEPEPRATDPADGDWDAEAATVPHLDAALEALRLAARTGSDAALQALLPRAVASDAHSRTARQLGNTTLAVLGAFGRQTGRVHGLYALRVLRALVCRPSPRAARLVREADLKPRTVADLVAALRRARRARRRRLCEEEPADAMLCEQAKREAEGADREDAAQTAAAAAADWDVNEEADGVDGAWSPWEAELEAAAEAELEGMQGGALELTEAGRVAVRWGWALPCLGAALAEGGHRPGDAGVESEELGGDGETAGSSSCAGAALSQVAAELRALSRTALGLHALARDAQGEEQHGEAHFWWGAATRMVLVGIRAARARVAVALRDAQLHIGTCPRAPSVRLGLADEVVADLEGVMVAGARAVAWGGVGDASGRSLLAASSALWLLRRDSAATISAGVDESVAFASVARATAEAAGALEEVMGEMGMGAAVSSLQRFEAGPALHLLAHAARHSTQQMTAHAVLGRLLQSQGQYLRAIRAFERVLRLTTRSTQLHALHASIGFCAYKLGRHGEALQHFETAIQLDPRNPTARVNLAVLLADQRRFDEAVQQLNLAERIARRNPLRDYSRLFTMATRLREHIADRRKQVVVDMIT